MRQGELGQTEHRPEVCGDDVVELGQIGHLDAAVHTLARVVHQYVDPAKLGDGQLDQPLVVIGLRHVRHDGEWIDFPECGTGCSYLGQLGFVTRRQDTASAEVGQQ
uniref:Uncharacterized protein n=1 Tax=Anopheles atroparvus TaxID=41427 RepID=A0A182J2J0_ANOAO